MSNKTNWNEYYKNPYKLVSFTRKITGRALLRNIKKHSKNVPMKVIELGGGNSCFLETFLRELNIDEYHIVDNNAVSIELAKKKSAVDKTIFTHNRDILRPESIPVKEADLAYSVGLIEHFSVSGTQKAIVSHFALVKRGSLVVITYPTPTIFYRTVRFLMEKFGMWIFYDERPLKAKEVEDVVRKHGEILHSSIIWNIVSTQGLLVARKF